MPLDEKQMLVEIRDTLQELINQTNEIIGANEQALIPNDITFDEVHQKALQMLRVDREGVRKLLEKYNAENIRQLQRSDYADFLEQISICLSEDD